MSKTKLLEYDYDTVITGGRPTGYTVGIYSRTTMNITASIRHNNATVNFGNGLIKYWLTI